MGWVFDLYFIKFSAKFALKCIQQIVICIYLYKEDVFGFMYFDMKTDNVRGLTINCA